MKPSRLIARARVSLAALALSVAACGAIHSKDPIGQRCDTCDLPAGSELRLVLAGTFHLPGQKHGTLEGRLSGRFTW